jgi:hypothetical protein
VLKLSGRGLVTLGQARLLSEDIDPVGLCDNPGEATRLTVFSPARTVFIRCPPSK